jgi:hypothetical protein
MSKKTSKREHLLLPWYLNDTLTGEEKKAVDILLRQEPNSQRELEAWRNIQKVLSNQPQQTPSPYLWNEIIHRLSEKREPRHAFGHLRSLGGFIAGLAITLAVLILLWLIIRPGIVLNWSISDDGMQSYRIFRAPQGTTDYKLLSQVRAKPGKIEYTYIDSLLLPWQNYSYIVEGVSQEGQDILSQTISTSARQALPGQLSLLITSLIVGFSILLLLQYWPLFPIRGKRMAI